MSEVCINYLHSCLAHIWLLINDCFLLILMLFLQKDHLKLVESKVEKMSMFRDLYSTFF